MQFKNNLSCICSFLSMSIIFTLCTLNSTLVNYYYNVKYTTYMVYFSITIYSRLTKKKLLLYVFLPNNPIHRKHIFINKREKKCSKPEPLLWLAHRTFSLSQMNKAKRVWTLSMGHRGRYEVDGQIGQKQIE